MTALAPGLLVAARDYVLNEPVPVYSSRWYELATALLPDDACERLGYHVCGEPDADALRAAIEELTDG